MVGDDAIEAQLPRPLHDSKRADAGVHANEHGESLGARPFDDFRAHAVAVPHAMRNVMVRLCADELQGSVEDDDGHGAVDVVVTVDENLFPLLDGLQNAADRCVHREHTKRIVEMIQAGREKKAGGRIVLDAAQREQPRKKRGSA